MLNLDSLHRAFALERTRKRRSRIIAFVVAVALLTPVGMTLASIAGYRGGQRMVLAPAIMAALLVAGLFILKSIQWLSGLMFTAFVAPGGGARGATGHSRAHALAASGLIEEAAAEFDDLRGKHGETIASLRAEAELHSTAGGDAKRAESLYLRMRRDKNVTPAEELYASHRLIDLYDGVMNDQGRVMVELRRMADRFPDTPDGQGARDALKRRKELHVFGAQDGNE